ncbi:MAG: hypothetical protein E6I43_04070 [Chloroflexi bacterium]|nr:MAG: hypothetical protein E6I43_04070 [Chloroflexota bacterium]
MAGGAVRRIHRAAVLSAALLLSLLGIAVIQAPTPASAAILNPYGFSVWGYQNRVTASGVKWVRLQRDWSSIETSPGVYNFSGLDQDVARANAAGVNATVPLQDAPSFRLTQVCNGVNLFPGPNEMSTFASIVAARYNGRNGHGYVASFAVPSCAPGMRPSKRSRRMRSSGCSGCGGSTPTMSRPTSPGSTPTATAATWTSPISITTRVATPR